MRSCKSSFGRSLLGLDGVLQHLHPQEAAGAVASAHAREAQVSSSSTDASDVASESTSNIQQSRGATNQKCKGRSNSAAPFSNLSFGQEWQIDRRRSLDQGRPSFYCLAGVFL